MRNILLIVILLLLLVIGWGVKLYYGQLAQNRFTVRQAVNLENDNALQSQLIRQKADSMGRLISTIRVTELERNTVRDLSEAQGSFINRQLLRISADQRDLKRIAKNLKGATSITVEAKGDFMAVMQDTVILRMRKFQTDSTVVKYDTVRVFAKSFNFREKNGWFELRGTVTNDSVQFQPVFRDKMDIITYRERKEKRYFFDFFRAKQTVVRYKSENPYSTLKDFQQINVK